MNTKKIALTMFALTFAAAPMYYFGKTLDYKDRAPASIYEVDLLHFENVDQSLDYFESIGNDIKKIKQIRKDILESKESNQAKLDGLKDVQEQIEKMNKNLEKALIKDVAITKAQRDELREIHEGIIKSVEEIDSSKEIASLKEEIGNESDEEKDCKAKENPIKKLAYEFDKFFKQNESILAMFRTTPRQQGLNIGNPYQIVSMQAQMQMQMQLQNQMQMQMQMQIQMPMTPFNLFAFNPLSSLGGNPSFSRMMARVASNTLFRPSNASVSMMGMHASQDVVATDVEIRPSLNSGQKRESINVESFDILK